MKMGKSARKRYLALVHKGRHRLSKRERSMSGRKTMSWSIPGKEFGVFFTVPICKHTASDLKYQARYRCGRRSFLSPYSSLVDYFKDSSRMYPPFYLMRHNKAKQKHFMGIQSKLAAKRNFMSERQKAERQAFHDSIFGDDNEG